MSLDAIALFKKYKQQVGYIESEFYVWKNKTNEQFESSLN
jgi:hypothetical protein